MTCSEPAGPLRLGRPGRLARHPALVLARTGLCAAPDAELPLLVALLAAALLGGALLAAAIDGEQHHGAEPIGRLAVDRHAAAQRRGAPGVSGVVLVGGADDLRLGRGILWHLLERAGDARRRALA